MISKNNNKLDIFSVIDVQRQKIESGERVFSVTLIA